MKLNTSLKKYLLVQTHDKLEKIIERTPSEFKQTQINKLTYRFNELMILNNISPELPTPSPTLSTIMGELSDAS